jgi:hypothetical protein
MHKPLINKNIPNGIGWIIPPKKAEAKKTKGAKALMINIYSIIYLIQYKQITYIRFKRRFM